MITNINKQFYLFELSDVFLLWIYFVVFVYFVVRTLIIGLANSAAKLKILGYCLNCIVAGTTSIGVGLEFHKMATDSAASYPIIPVKPTYWWQKATLGYKTAQRPDLELAKTFIAKFPDQQIPIDSDGFVDRETCLAKIKKKFDFINDYSESLKFLELQKASS